MLFQLAAFCILHIEMLKGVNAASSNSYADCRTIKGDTIRHGQAFSPGASQCTMCTCDNGQPKDCKQVLCAPPLQCTSFRMGEACCDYICLGDTFPRNHSTDRENSSDFGVRMIASGLAVTLSITILCYFIKRLRKRKCRENENRHGNDENRNISSIGYIGGNMNYMGNGNMNIDYSYEPNSGHYHLWKPHNGYYPRGEAPPPYEEAVALSQAEAMNSVNSIQPQQSQCNVSVASAPHRTLPMNMCNEDSYRNANTDYNSISPLIQPNTTNLINININNGGGITSVATGETHQPSIPICTNMSESRPIHQSQPSAQNFMHVNPLNVNTNEVLPNLYSISNIDQHPPNTNNNEIVEKNINMICPAPLTNNKSTRAKNHRHSSASDQSTLHRREMKQQENCIQKPEEPQLNPVYNTMTLPAHRDTTGNLKTPSSSRRNHRTIPRHFQLAEPVNNPAKKSEEPKKPTCQCPVQHVPMNYIGTSYINHSPTTRANPQENHILSMLSNKLNNQKFNVAKATSFLSSGKNPVNSSPKSEAAIVDMMNSGIEPTVNAKPTHSLTEKIKSSRGTTSVSNTGSNISKIPTISKHVNEMSLVRKSSVDLLKMGCQLKEQQVDKNPVDIDINNGASGLAENPILPPKMYKNMKTPATPSKLHRCEENAKRELNGNSKIHIISQNDNELATTSRPVDLPLKNFVFLDHHKSPGQRIVNHNEETAALLSDYRPMGRIKAKSINSSNAYTTLPKQQHNRMAINGSISEVVSKVPAVVNIPNQSLPCSVTDFSQMSSLNTTCSSLGTTKSILSYPTNSLKRVQPRKSPISSGNMAISDQCKVEEKPLPVCTTYKNCSNPKEHFLPNDTSLDDDYLSECENCKSAHGSRYYLDEEIEEPQETMTLQRKMDQEKDVYFRTSSTLPTQTKQKSSSVKNREPWFSTIPDSSSDEERVE